MGPCDQEVVRIPGTAQAWPSPPGEAVAASTVLAALAARADAKRQHLVQPAVLQPTPVLQSLAPDLRSLGLDPRCAVPPGSAPARIQTSLSALPLDWKRSVPLEQVGCAREGGSGSAGLRLRGCWACCAAAVCSVPALPRPAEPKSACLLALLSSRDAYTIILQHRLQVRPTNSTHRLAHTSAETSYRGHPTTVNGVSRALSRR